MHIQARLVRNLSQKSQKHLDERAQLSPVYQQVHAMQEIRQLVPAASSKSRPAGPHENRKTVNREYLACRQVQQQIEADREHLPRSQAVLSTVIHRDQQPCLPGIPLLQIEETVAGLSGSQ